MMGEPHYLFVGNLIVLFAFPQFDTEKLQELILLVRL